MARDTYNAQHPKRRKKAHKAQQKLKTIAGKLIRELERTLSKEALEKHLHALEFNAFLAATGWNLKKMIKKLKEELKNILFRFIQNQVHIPLQQSIFH